MKNIIYILLVLVLILGGYFYLRIDENKTLENAQSQMAVFTGADVGLQFTYPSGTEGYVLEERMPADLGTGLVKVILLSRAEDVANPIPEGGEAPPAISISVFENSKKQFPSVWAQENTQYSNINLKIGEVAEAVVGGANAIRYMADGLYASDNVVVAHGDNMYVITNQFTDEIFDPYINFSLILDSIVFIPKPGQE